MRKLYAALEMVLPRKMRIILRFMIKHRYIPNLEKPKSFSEKMQVRKLHWVNPLFVVCSDKYRVRDYVAQTVGSAHLIPLLYCGTSLDYPELLRIWRESYGVALKANHNSGPVFILPSTVSPEALGAALDNVERQLRTGYGEQKFEGWYDAIPTRMVLVEQLLLDGGKIPTDWKFHVFNDGDSAQVIVQLDFDRFGNHNRSWYDSNLEPLPFECGYRNDWQVVRPPDNFADMRTIAMELAAPFSYARIDLYNVNGKIFFGEITFAHGSGFERFQPRAYDFKLGQMWRGNPGN